MTVIGAGVGGLAAAVDLANRGASVTVLERGPRVGGKMREIQVGGLAVDSGPTVMTMKHVFEELFAETGADLADYVRLSPMRVLARHAWLDGTRFDLYADPAQTEAELRDVFGAKSADGYRRFHAYARAIHDEVEAPFMRSERPSLFAMMRIIGSRGLGAVRRIDFRRTMWRAIGEFFDDPRLRQLFARYATYYGSSPFYAPATLNLIAYVEARGVWSVDGGMYRMAEALARRATELGVQIHTNVEVAKIDVQGGRACGVITSAGERLDADAVVLNGDPSALTSGRLGTAVSGSVPPRGRVAPKKRSLSAITWSMAARSSGFELDHHNVFFSDDYETEFRQLIDERRLPSQPTVYVCAQHRAGGARPEGHEGLLALVNAPARGDDPRGPQAPGPFDEAELERCEHSTFELMTRCGLQLDVRESRRTTPIEFERMFPATGGALYGPATHGSMAPFSRPSTRSRVRRLYLVGGGAHPGAGIPMVTLGGRIAAKAVSEDLASMRPSAVMAISGGTSTSSATTDATP